MNPIDVAEILFQAGFRSGAGVTAMTVVAAETGGAFDPALEFDNTKINPSTGKPYGVGVDHGLWMINDHWHPEVSHECAHDPLCSSKEAFRISNGGTNFSQWNVVKNGLHTKYLPLAKVSWEAAKRIRTLKASIAAKDLSIAGYKTHIAEADAEIMRQEAIIEADKAYIAALELQRDELAAAKAYAETYLKTVHDRLHAKADEIMTAP